MLDIAWVILCAILGAPLIINPKKVVERPACRIKSPAVVRILGVVIILLGILQPVIHMM
ncbi:MAG: hypothetical protein HFG46_14235 [Clostridium sp.]|nr:hypothetical protein [Clostridium sp.]